MKAEWLVVVQADGTFVHERGGEKMEAKGGIVNSRPVTVSKGRRLVLDKQTITASKPRPLSVANVM